MRFFLYFLSKIFLYFKTYFYGIKPFFIKMQHDMQHAYYPSAKSISKNFEKVLIFKICHAILKSSDRFYRCVASPFMGGGVG